MKQSKEFQRPIKYRNPWDVEYDAGRVKKVKQKKLNGIQMNGNSFHDSKYNPFQIQSEEIIINKNKYINNNNNNNNNNNDDEGNNDNNTNDI